VRINVKEIVAPIPRDLDLRIARFDELETGRFLDRNAGNEAITPEAEWNGIARR